MKDANQALSIAVVEAIKHHHHEAMSHAAQAIDHAKQAGELLLKAKANIQHGGWLSWLTENCAVSPRQAQRYMEAAQAKKVPIRELTKNDTVSHLPEPTARAPGLSDYIPEPTFVPEPGRWMLTSTDEAAFHVVPALEHPGFFHISKLYTVPAVSFDPEFHIEDGDLDSLFFGTKKPVRADVVEAFLQFMGLAKPSKAAWDTPHHPGMLRPFGEPESNLGTMRDAINTHWPGQPKR